MNRLPGNSFGAQLRHFKRERIEKLPAAIVRGTVEEFSDRLVRFWSPFGDPALWKAPPPADYKPGNFRSSWIFSVGSASAAKTDATDHDQAPWGIEGLGDVRAGVPLYLSNSADHAGALEACHSSQAPTGIMVNSLEFEGIAYAVTRRVAG